uniref:Helicase ATP-binding domain-containing protein n=1 Tax=Panagrolaimus superbus TaxID=310955 RepID=A0A914ZCM0_9BILA
MTNGNESKHAYNLFFGNISPYHLRPLLYENTADAPLNLHEYQYELVEKALQGENILICAPTGSGKTIAAAYITREHIFELRKNQKIAKIVFVVPSVPLVEQQTNQFKRFLGHCAKIIGRHGGSEELDFNSLISSVDIIVLTPQVLV